MFTIPSLSIIKDETEFVDILANRIKDVIWLLQIKADHHLDSFTRNCYNQAMKFSWNKIFPQFLGILEHG